MVPSRQTRPEGRGKTLDFNDVIAGFYRMCNLYDYIEDYVKFIHCVKWHVFLEPVTYYATFPSYFLWRT